jgi:hypothetical protein
MEAEGSMKFPLVTRKTYERDVALARIQPTATVTVSDAQVQTVVAAIDRAADEIVAAVKSVP